MKDVKIGRITLSFTFISLGIVMFLEKFSHYQWVDLFSILWPSIIIFFGLEIIYNLLCAKKENKTKPKIDKLSIVVVALMVITIGIGTTVVSQFPHMKKIINKRLEYKYRENISEKITLNKIKRLVIDDVNTDIIINRSQSGDIEVRLEGVYKYNKKRSNDFKFINVKNSREVTRITKHIKNRRRNIKNMNTEDMKYLIFLPVDVDIEVVSRYGDILLDLESNESNNVDIHCYHGDVSVILPSDQLGKFNITTTYGSIYDGLKFDVIESISSMRINETRTLAKPNFDIRVNNGDIILETD